MGNCFRSTSATDAENAATRPSKRHKTSTEGEQKYVVPKVLKLRDEASACHDKVVALAKQASEAYQKGQKKEAHDFSEAKKKWQQKKDDANQRAAKLILSAQPWQSSGEIDLHGLYLEEALDATTTFLTYWSKRTAARTTVLIITGAGHHSENQKAVIRPQVEKLLRRQKLQFESVSKDGAFNVHLRPSQ